MSDTVNSPAQAAQAIPEIERVEVKGAALAFPGDENALGVLQRAAELHTRREDPWLGVQTLLHALIDSRNKPSNVEQLAPLALFGNRFSIPDKRETKKVAKKRLSRTLKGRRNSP